MLKHNLRAEGTPPRGALQFFLEDAVGFIESAADGLDGAVDLDVVFERPAQFGAGVAETFLPWSRVRKMSNSRCRGGDTLPGRRE